MPICIITIANRMFSSLLHVESLRMFFSFKKRKLFAFTLESATSSFHGFSVPLPHSNDAKMAPTQCFLLQRRS